MKLRLYQILLVHVLTVAVPTIHGDTLQQYTVLPSDGPNNFANLDGVATGLTIWADSSTNLTAWSLSGDAPAILRVNGSLSLSVSFPSKTVAQAVSASMSLNLPLYEDSILTVTLTVTWRIPYGIRFLG